MTEVKFKKGARVLPSGYYRAQFPKRAYSPGTILRRAKYVSDGWVVKWDNYKMTQLLHESFLTRTGLTETDEAAAKATAARIVEQISYRCQQDHGAATAWCPEYAAEIITAALLASSIEPERQSRTALSGAGQGGEAK